MDNHERRVRYLLAAHRPDGVIRESIESLLRGAYEAGTGDELLTPAQLRRIRHKRAGQGAHRRAQRGRRMAALAAKLARMAPR